jgi:hypothetical protein
MLIAIILIAVIAIAMVMSATKETKQQEKPKRLPLRKKLTQRCSAPVLKRKRTGEWAIRGGSPLRPETLDELRSLAERAGLTPSRTRLGVNAGAPLVLALTTTALAIFGATSPEGDVMTMSMGGTAMGLASALASLADRVLDRTNATLVTISRGKEEHSITVRHGLEKIERMFEDWDIVKKGIYVPERFIDQLGMKPELGILSVRVGSITTALTKVELENLAKKVGLQIWAHKDVGQLQIREESLATAAKKVDIKLEDMKKTPKYFGTLYATPSRTIQVGKVVIDEGMPVDGQFKAYIRGVEGYSLHQLRTLFDKGLIKGQAIVCPSSPEIEEKYDWDGKGILVVTCSNNLKKGVSKPKGEMITFFLDNIGTAEEQYEETNRPIKAAMFSMMSLCQQVWDEESLACLKEAASASACDRMKWFINALERGGEGVTAMLTQTKSETGDVEVEISPIMMARNALIRGLGLVKIGAGAFTSLLTLLRPFLDNWQAQNTDGFTLTEDGVSYSKWDAKDTIRKTGTMAPHSGVATMSAMCLNPDEWNDAICRGLEKKRKLESVVYNPRSACFVGTRYNGDIVCFDLVSSDGIEGVPNGIAFVSNSFINIILELLGGADLDGDTIKWRKSVGDHKGIKNPLILERDPVGPGEVVFFDPMKAHMDFRFTKQLDGSLSDPANWTRKPLPVMPTPKLKTFYFVNVECKSIEFTGKAYTKKTNNRYVELAFAKGSLGENANRTMMSFLAIAENCPVFKNEPLVDGFQQMIMPLEFYSAVDLAGQEIEDAVKSRGSVSPYTQARFMTKLKKSKVTEDTWLEEFVTHKVWWYTNCRRSLIDYTQSLGGQFEIRKIIFERTLEEYPELKALWEKEKTNGCLSFESQSNKEIFEKTHVSNIQEDYSWRTKKMLTVANIRGPWSDEYNPGEIVFLIWAYLTEVGYHLSLTESEEIQFFQDTMDLAAPGAKGVEDSEVPHLVNLLFEKFVKEKETE